MCIPAISALQPVSRITGKDSFPICLAAIHDDAIRAAMTVESLVEEPLCRSKIAIFAEEKLDRVTNAVDGAGVRLQYVLPVESYALTVTQI